MGKSKVYISGPITGTDDYLERFERAESYIRSIGAVPYNPAAVNEGLPTEAEYEECMQIAMCMMDMCDTVYMLEGWQDSRGANREYGYALGRNMTLIRERAADYG